MVWNQMKHPAWLDTLTTLLSVTVAAFLYVGFLRAIRIGPFFPACSAFSISAFLRRGLLPGLQAPRLTALLDDYRLMEPTGPRA